MRHEFRINKGFKGLKENELRNEDNYLHFRPIINEDKKLFIVAIDGFRLALRKSIIVDGSEDFSAIIPGKYLNEIIKNVSDDDNIC